MARRTRMVGSVAANSGLPNSAVGDHQRQATAQINRSRAFLKMPAPEPRALPVGYDGYGFQPTSLDREKTQTYWGQLA